MQSQLHLREVGRNGDTNSPMDPTIWSLPIVWNFTLQAYFGRKSKKLKTSAELMLSTEFATLKNKPFIILAAK